MNTLEVLASRKAIKEWRDRWTEQISKDLEDSIPELRSLVLAEVEKMNFVDSFLFKRYVTTKLQPVFVEWGQRKEEALLRAAEKDLRVQLKRSAAYHGAKSKLEIKLNNETLYDVAGAALSGTASVAAIPAIISFSTATASAGGIAGFLGATTTLLVISNLVIGLIVLAIMSVITSWRFSKIKTNLKTRLRKQIEQQIQERVVYSKTGPSLAMLLTDRIEDTARQLLSEIDHAA